MVSSFAIFLSVARFVSRVSLSVTPRRGCVLKPLAGTMSEDHEDVRGFAEAAERGMARYANSHIFSEKISRLYICEYLHTVVFG